MIAGIFAVMAFLLVISVIAEATIGILLYLKSKKTNDIRYINEELEEYKGGSDNE